MQLAITRRPNGLLAQTQPVGFDAGFVSKPATAHADINAEEQPMLLFISCKAFDQSHDLMLYARIRGLLSIHR